MYIYIYIYTHMCIYTCVYIYIYIYIYIGNCTPEYVDDRHVPGRRGLGDEQAIGDDYGMYLYIYIYILMIIINISVIVIVIIIVIIILIYIYIYIYILCVYIYICTCNGHMSKPRRVKCSTDFVRNPVSTANIYAYTPIVWNTVHYFD